MINVALDTKMMWGRTLLARSFTKGADPTKNTKNTRREMRGISRGEHKRTLKSTRMITHVLDPRNTKRDTRSKVNNGRYKR